MQTKDYECLIRELINKEFDPFAPFLNDGSGLALYYNQLTLEAYSLSGYDLATIAALGIDNPMTVLDFANTGVPVEWVELMSPSRRTPGQAFFLNEMGLSLENVTNYEPNYLSAMMDANPESLQAAQQNYYDTLLDQHEDVQDAYEWLLITKELIGPDTE